ncbi:hypothetical protein MNBD_BACTEROID02-1706 [hydrothermal vent metagenome]|jgi:hypothetical protein|uniref:Lipoprotein n=1 Tax=hydrothermal vent metagenome TaxID=652676 RepID=A0A3B0R5I6_9ZZZZ
MKDYSYILILIFLFSCVEQKNNSVQKKESTNLNLLELKDNPRLDYINKGSNIKKIDFTKPPVSIKRITLNDEKFWVTSSMVDAKYLDDSFCNYKDYHLERGYDIILKTNDIIINQLKVYVKDDSFKWNREKASEEFMSIEINNESIKPWNTFFVGMHVDSLLPYVINEEYHSDYGAINVYTKDYQLYFYLMDSLVEKILISRNCEY